MISLSEFIMNNFLQLKEYEKSLTYTSFMRIDNQYEQQADIGEI